MVVRRERTLMVRALVRWGGECADQLAHKRDHEIEDMADKLKRTIVVPDSCCDNDNLPRDQL